MLRLEEILNEKGLGKVFYHEKCEDLKFHVYYDAEAHDYLLLVHGEDKIVQAPIMGSLLEGFYTKED